MVLVPINGDSDLFLSFDHPKPTRADATWVEESIGVKQFTLPKSNPHYCAATAALPDMDGALRRQAA